MLYLLDPEIAMLEPATAHNNRLPIDQVMACNSLDQAVAVVAEIYDFQWHPYFLWMRSVEVDRAAFLASQLPFRYAVESFSQSLAAVLAKVPTVEARMALLENINEEHGQGNPLRSHKATFRQYLQSLGATSTELELPITTDVLAFNQSILNYCLSQSPEAGAAMLGMIEHLYVGVSGTIARTIHGCGWVKPGMQSHYVTHEVLDVEHAQDLFQMARPGWDYLPLQQQVAQGLLLGGHYFWSLYDGLLPK
jgi:pyrroloquinoline-quinone synthase